MGGKNKPLVSICIPHWQVRELITPCLRAIRKFTQNIPIEVIVVDNGSKDESLPYLRSLSWIKLIERGQQTPENWVEAFITALDLGFENSCGKYFAIMHTDTFVKHPLWLERLTEPMDKDPKCAAVGAWKLELRHPVYEFTKKITDTKKAKLWLRRNLFGDQSARQLKRELCPRDYCAIYRAEPIRKFGLRFREENRWRGYTAGEQMYYQLKENGYRAEVIDTAEMMKYMEHLAHATAGLRPKQRHLNHRHAQKKSERKLRRFFDSPLIKELMEDESLDHELVETAL
ncbi:MAG: glycosyltransferase family 2 protein [Sedimentisphaerales bacterium]|nr:glycosyltransferase family 2 protein [Sedimentisphaerales bacterium]